MLVNLSIFSGDDFKRHYKQTLSTRWLHEYFKKLFDLQGTKRITTEQLKAFFRTYRLKFTVLNVAGQIIDHYSPEQDGKSRNKDFRSVHLFFVQHNQHCYTLTKNKASFERKQFSKALQPMKEPKPWSQTPPQTAYDAYACNIKDINKCLVDLRDTVDKPAKLRINYAAIGGLEPLFHWFRHAHSLEPQIVSFPGHIKAMSIQIDTTNIMICDGPVTSHPPEMNDWLNRFKRAMFNKDSKSVYSANVRHAFTEYRKAQLWCRFAEDVPASSIGVDITRFYTKAACLIKKIPTFLYTDDFEVYDSKPIDDYSLYVVRNDGTEDIERYIVADREHSLMTGYTLNRCGLTFEVLYVLKPSHLAHNYFPGLIKDLLEADVGECVKKFTPNICIGMMGKMRNINHKGYFTTCRDEADALIGKTNERYYDPKNGEVMASNVEGWFAVRKSEAVVVDEGWYPFQMWVYCIARLQMLQLYRELKKNTDVYAIMTDRFWVREIPEDLPLHNKKFGTSFDDLGKYHIDDERPMPQIMHEVKKSPHLIQPQPVYSFTRVLDKTGTLFSA